MDPHYWAQFPYQGFPHNEYTWNDKQVDEYMEHNGWGANFSQRPYIPSRPNHEQWLKEWREYEHNLQQEIQEEFRLRKIEEERLNNLPSKDIPYPGGHNPVELDRYYQRLHKAKWREEEELRKQREPLELEQMRQWMLNPEYQPPQNPQYQESESSTEDEGISAIYQLPQIPSIFNEVLHPSNPAIYDDELQEPPPAYIPSRPSSPQQPSFQPNNILHLLNRPTRHYPIISKPFVQREDLGLTISKLNSLTNDDE
jgi:hypothetical protein